MASAEKEYPSCQPPRHPWLLLDAPASWIFFTVVWSRQTESSVPCSLEIFDYLWQLQLHSNPWLLILFGQIVMVHLCQRQELLLLAEQMGAKEQTWFRNTRQLMVTHLTDKCGSETLKKLKLVRVVAYYAQLVQLHSHSLGRFEEAKI